MPNKKQKEFKSAPEKTIKLEKEVKNTKKNKLAEVSNYLKKTYDFRYNLFVKKPEFKLKESDAYEFYDERYYDNLMTEIKLFEGLVIGKDELNSLIGSEYMSPDFDPIRDYVLSLPKWDKVPRFEKFLQQIQLKDESHRPLLHKYFTKWFVALVASLVDDHVINDTCFVFTGEQGRGKTRFFESLVPEYLRMHYTFTGNYNPRDKDEKEMLGTKIIINLDEMGTLNRNDVETLKTTLSTRFLTLRRAFGRAPIYLKRRASFCGSINKDEFLTDQTGNRRWIPFAIHNIDVDNNFDIGLLYAEALALFKEGFVIYMDRIEIKELNDYNDQFRHVSMEEEMILTNFKKPTDKEIEIGTNIKYLSTTDIVNKLASRDEYRKINVNDTMLKRMGYTLKSLGFKKVTRRVPGVLIPIKVWILKEIDGFEADKIKSGSYGEKEF